MRLSPAIIDALPATVQRPAYRPAEHGIGIVHLGIGAFHRAHQTVMTDDCLALHGGDWRIVGVSLRSAAVRDQLAPQGGLYTLNVCSDGPPQYRIIGAVADVIVAPHDPAAVIARIADPATHIVTLTVTEKGYCLAGSDLALDLSHPDIVHDIAHPAAPVSAIGMLLAGLRVRAANGHAPITIISCDNLPGNGRLLGAALLGLAGEMDPTLVGWINDHVAFPSTMVDRIVPATTDADRSALYETMGYIDEGLVKGEAFSQWVIEDNFAGPRPRWEDAGAQIVEDVRPFEVAKLRMLNGSHSTMAYLGLAAGHVTVDQAINDPAIARVVDALMCDAAQTLPEAEALDPIAYAAALKARFANPAIGHKLAQIAMDGSQKLPQRLFVLVEELSSRGLRSDAAVLGIAAWMRHFDGPYLNDPLAEQLRATVDANNTAFVDKLLAMPGLFGALSQSEPFRQDLLAALDHLDHGRLLV